ncbi:hypothetical protein Nepgr_017158 [Nepenthes gracilis]|uniref:Elongator complex protein 4 n=1 Tax=Nepenthes gracilis TaxID=150966 RepID=A0AAD3SRV9_NEPGR|nr:hypothetical protein Nepgr_017158 [Nepenthes gracilis]
MGTTDLCKGSFQRGIYTMEMDVMKGKMHSLLKSPEKLFGLSTVPKFPQAVMAAIKFPSSSFSRNPLVGSTSQNPTLKPGPNSSVFISSSVPGVDEILGGGLCLESLIIVMEDPKAPHHVLLLRNFIAQSLVQNQPLLYAKPSKDSKFFLGTLPSPMLSHDNKPHDRVEQEKGLKIAWQYKKYFEEGEQTSNNRNNKLKYCNDCDLWKTWKRHILTRKPIECVSMEDSTNDNRKLLDCEYNPNDTLHHAMDWIARRVSDFGLAKLALEADAHVSSREMGLDSFLVVRELAEQETDNGIFKMLHRDVTQFRTSILIGTTVANIGATALVIAVATEISGEVGVGAAIEVITVAVLLLSKINPTGIFVPNATEVARFMAVDLPSLRGPFL